MESFAFFFSANVQNLCRKKLSKHQSNLTTLRHHYGFYHAVVEKRRKGDNLHKVSLSPLLSFSLISPAIELQNQCFRAFP
jgi:hypothetical protein